jgi:hypothetical protein
MSNTVEGMLMQNNIFIDSTAIVFPSIDTILKENMYIMIYSEHESAKINLDEYTKQAFTKCTEKYFAESQIIEFEVVEQSNTEAPRGHVATTQNGEAGEKQINYIKRYVDGNEVATFVVSEEILKEPINQVIEVGTNLSNVSRGSVNRITAKDIAVDSSFTLYNIKLSPDLQRYAYNMCKTYGVNYETFLAVMYTESRFNTGSISSTNDYGLCQINMANFNHLNKVLGITDLLNPYDNIKAGAYWLSRYYTAWGSSYCTPEYEYNVLNSYNFGVSSYKRYLASGHDAYSWYYAHKVLSAKSTLIENGGI